MPRTLHLPENMRGRDFIVGDIHGMFSTLELALKKVSFDPSKDRVICVGDLIDRGPESERCLEFLAKPWFISARGNHEAMFLKLVTNGVLDHAAAAGFVKHGMGWLFDQTPQQLLEFETAFRQLPFAIEIAGQGGPIGIVHAEVPAGMSWQNFMTLLDKGDRNTAISALWSRSRFDGGDKSGVPGVTRVFSGHTPQIDGLCMRGNCFYIDTGAIFGKLDNKSCYFLTLVDARARTEVLTAPAKPDSDGICVVRNLPLQARPRPPAPPKP